MPPLTLKESASVYLLYYERPLEALMLTEGPVLPASSMEPSRPLPSHAQGHQAVWQKSQITGWAPLDAQAQLESIRLPSQGPRACAEMGGCFPDEMLAAQDLCDEACSDITPPSPPEAPAPCARPVFAPCPQGWTENNGLCMPAPFERCAPRTARFGDQPSCAPLGPDCPQDGLPNLPGAIYVRSGAQGGNGSRTNPFGSISQALQGAPSGAQIALSIGQHAAPTTLQDVRLQGACAQTVLVGPMTLRNGASLRSLSVEGALTTDGAVQLQEVALEQSTLTIERGNLQASQVAIRAPSEPGLSLNEGRAELDGLYLQGAALIQGGALQLQRAVFSHDGPAAALSVLQGATASVSVALFDAAAVGASVAGGALHLRSALIQNASIGVQADRGALELERTIILRSRDSGLQALQDATVTALDLHVGEAQQNAQAGLFVRDAELRAQRVHLDRQRDSSVLVIGDRANVSFQDLTITNATRPESFGEDQVLSAVRHFLGGTLNIERARLEDVDGRAIAVGENEPTDHVYRTALTDVHILRTQRTEGSGGDGIDLSHGAADTQLRRVVIEEAGRWGVWVRGNASAQIYDLRVENALMGVRSSETAAFTMERAHFSQARAMGLCVRGESRATVTDLLTEAALTPLSSDAGSDFCAFGVPGGGDGVSINNIANLDLMRFVIRDNPGNGLVVRSAESFRAREGQVLNNKVGIQLASEVPLSSMMLRVRYEQNEVQLDVQ